MARFCGNCGTSLAATANFCGGCGTRVPAPPPASVTPQAPVAPVVPVTLAPAPVTPPVTTGFASVSGQFTQPEVASSAGFSSVPSTIPPVPASPAASADFAPVSGNFGQPEPATAAGFSSLPSSFPTGPVPVDLAGFAPVSEPLTQPDATPAAGYNPVVSAPVPPAVPTGFASVQQSAAPATPVNNAVFSSVPSSYTPTPAPFTPAPVNTNTTGYTPVSGAPSAGFAPAAGQPAYVPGAAYPAKKSNTLLIVIVAFLVLIFAGGALALGGIWYAARKVTAKVHSIAAQVTGDTDSATDTPHGMTPGASGIDDGDGGIKGDPCRFLTKAEVSKAVGLPVVRTEASKGSCSYIIHGDPADITAKHMSAMLGGMGVSADAQKMAQKFAGGLFAQTEANDKDLSAEAAKGEVPALTLAFTSGHAAAEMKLNRLSMQHIGATDPSGSHNAASSGGDLAGIGDEAYSSAGSMIMLRKGSVVARMMYVSCPCNTENMKPLASILASRL